MIGGGTGGGQGDAESIVGQGAQSCQRDGDGDGRAFVGHRGGRDRQKETQEQINEHHKNGVYPQDTEDSARQSQWVFVRRGWGDITTRETLDRNVTFIWYQKSKINDKNWDCKIIQHIWYAPSIYCAKDGGIFGHHVTIWAETLCILQRFLWYAISDGYLFLSLENSQRQRDWVLCFASDHW